eukprot:gene7641-15644_t
MLNRAYKGHEAENNCGATEDFNTGEDTDRTNTWIECLPEEDEEDTKEVKTRPAEDALHQGIGDLVGQRSHSRGSNSRRECMILAVEKIKIKREDKLQNHSPQPLHNNQQIQALTNVLLLYSAKLQQLPTAICLPNS